MASDRWGDSAVIVPWRVDDVPAVIERLRAMGATPRQPPLDFGEGFVGASVIDPFGNILGVAGNRHDREVLARTDLA